MRAPGAIRVTFAVLIAAVMLAGGVASAGVHSSAVPAFGNDVLATGSSNQIYPQTDANYVVYQTGNPIVMGSYNVVLHDLSDGSDVTIGGGDGVSQTMPDVSQGRVVYRDPTSGSSDVFLYDSWTNSYTPIATTADEETMPRVSGNLVAWYNEDTDRIWYRDIVRGFSAQVPDSSNVVHLDVDRGRIFWSDALVTQNVYVFEPGLDTASTPIWENLNNEDILSLTAHGDYAALTADGPTSLRAHRVSTTGSFGLTLASDTSYPSAFHDALTLQTGSAGHDIRWYDWPKEGTHEDTLVSSDAADETYPSIFGNRVVYEHEATALNEDIYIATAATEVTRTQGPDRYATAVEASKAYFHAAENAVLCTGRNFPDALAAGPLARLLNAPLLLTKDLASDETMAELERLGVTKVFLIGGPDVVSTGVEDQLDEAGIAAQRIFGDDRYETATEIARYMDTQLTGFWSVDRAFFARGDDFPDALALGPVAANSLSPIILVKESELPAVVSDALDDLDITSGAIAGGSDVVSNDVRDDLRSIMVTNGGDEMDPLIVERWSGADRYETALAVVENGLDARLIDLDTVGVATGRNFPDALGGGAALSHYGSPILLVKEPLPAVVETWFTDNDEAIGRVDVFGGPDVVSDTVMGLIATAVE